MWKENCSCSSQRHVCSRFYNNRTVAWTLLSMWKYANVESKGTKLFIVMMYSFFRLKIGSLAKKWVTTITWQFPKTISGNYWYSSGNDSFCEFFSVSKFEAPNQPTFGTFLAEDDSSLSFIMSNKFKTFYFYNFCE